MDRVVSHLQEPSRLFVAWQAPDEIADRHRWAVGYLSKDADGFVLEYFDEPNLLRWNRPKEDLSVRWQYGYRGYPGFDPAIKIHRKGVREAVLRRLPPPQRSDFPAYKGQFLLPPDRSLSEFTLLARTEAKLPGDGFSFVDPLTDEGDTAELLLDVAGYRHYAPRLPKHLLRRGVPVHLALDPQNQWDPHAVIMRVGGETLGFVNRLQTAPFHRWLPESDVVADLERLNGSQGHPRAFVFVTIRPRISEAA